MNNRVAAPPILPSSATATNERRCRSSTVIRSASHTDRRKGGCLTVRAWPMAPPSEKQLSPLRVRTGLVKLKVGEWRFTPCFLGVNRQASAEPADPGYENRPNLSRGE